MNSLVLCDKEKQKRRTGEAKGREKGKGKGKAGREERKEESRVCQHRGRVSVPNGPADAFPTGKDKRAP